MAQNVQKKQSSRGMLMLVILWLAYVLFAMNWVTGSTLTPEIIKAFFKGPVSPLTMQVVNYSITLARVFANFLAAFILIKLGPKHAVTTALVLLMFSIIAVWIPNYWGYTVARMIMTLGGSMIIVYMNPVVARYVRTDRKIIANALNTVSYNFGAFVVALAFLFAGKFLRFDWQITLTVLASVSILYLLIWQLEAVNFNTKQDVDVGAHEEVHYGYRDAIRDPFVWHYSLGFGGFLFLYVLSITSLPSLFATYAPRVNGSLIELMVTGFGILGTAVGTMIGLTNHARKPILFWTGVLMILGSAATLIFAAKAPSLAYVAAGATGFIMFIMYPLYMNLPHEMPDMSPEKLTIIFGMFWAISYFVYTILNIIWSVILGNLGWTAAGEFWIFGSLLYLVFVLQLPETKPHELPKSMIKPV
ncbi:MFS transporter [Loigolactobacillus backii]|uniref:MFS transporter n=1 Tax=Loigolactobacillus backii TaxID=375175 RepID=UPI0022FD7A15|nr:MFS transporter [Loigolactobacillus backii]MDA5387385.1 MFS transporter [Loigolactobacillus backii]MDA5389924.1 MFS transporter [Loigolactobacillus backii]